MVQHRTPTRVWFEVKIVARGWHHTEQDHRKRALADARNLGDARVYDMEKLIKQHGDKLSDADRQAVKTAIEKVRDKLKKLAGG